MTDTTELRAEFEKWAFDQPDFSTMVPWDVASLAFQAGHASANQQHEGLRKDAELSDEQCEAGWRAEVKTWNGGGYDHIGEPAFIAGARFAEKHIKGPL